MFTQIPMTYGQKQSAREDNAIRLTKAQIIHLQTHGLLAGPDETWMHPEGSFCLAPSYGIGRRARIAENGKFTAERSCRNCGSPFEPKRPSDAYCSYACVQIVRKRKAA